MKVAGWVSVALALAVSAFVYAEVAAAPMIPAPVEAHAVYAPQIVAGSDGLRHLAYELSITNFYTSTGKLNLTEVTVFEDKTDVPLARFTGAELAGLLPPNKALEVDNSLAIQGGMHTVIFIWLSLPARTTPPITLRHHLVFRTEQGTDQIADDVAVKIDKAPVQILGSPFRGGLWLTDEGPGLAQSHHWGSLVAENGRLTSPQRYAVDFFGLDAQGHGVKVPFAQLNQSETGDWTGYGTDIVAVADGIVRDAQDGVPDNKILAGIQSPDILTTRTLYGNFVVLEIAPHVFVHYAHMKSGTVAVRPGDKVKKGALLGRLGVSGGAGAPHLHFHVSDKVGFADSQGQPFVFERFLLRGHGSEGDTLNINRDVEMPADTQKRLQRAMPLNGDLIAF
jgi:hypothetical protein